MQSSSGQTHAPQTRRNSGNYFLRHWRGELSLPISFWVNNLLGNTALLAASYLLTVHLDSASGYSEFSALSGFIIFMAAIVLWQTVGTWRSASAHPGRGGSRFWAGAARVMVAIAALRVILDFGQGLGPVWLETAKMTIGGDAQFESPKITVLRGSTELEFRGGINEGATKELARILDAMPKIETIHLTSLGGRIAEGRRMGQEIRRRGLATYVRAECTSACTGALLGGSRRFLAKGAKIGFHSPDIPGLAGEMRTSMLASEQRQMLDSGLPDWFVSKALNFPHEEVWYPTETELKAANELLT